jgi:replication-associated recombination protein RarA
MVTKKGLDFFEVSSAFQKAIRRGEEEVAMRMGEELFDSGFGEYCWKRMKIITSEDVGLAEPNMPAVIWSLYQIYQEQVKKKDEKHCPERLYLYHAIILLVRAKKSRYVDWALTYIRETNKKLKLEIPDYAYDMHTRKGKAMSRGMDHFYNEGSKLENIARIDGEEEMRQKSFESEPSEDFEEGNDPYSLFK